MITFTIRDIENLCGIKAHTLRIWEKRYGILSPKRKESNHRIYDNEDLKYWLRISYLYHNGEKISRIASLAAEDLKNESLRCSTSVEKNHLFIKELTEASISFDTSQFETTFRQCIQTFGIENAILDVVYPYLKKIGVLWLTDHIIPAQEHFSSNLINSYLIIAINDLKTEPSASGRHILLYTPSGEHHEIPLLFTYYLLKKNGDKVIYFGTNIAVDDLGYYTRQKPITHIHLHLITMLLQMDISEYVQKLADKYPEKTIVVSGPKASDVSITAKNVILLLSMDSLLEFCRKT